MKKQARVGELTAAIEQCRAVCAAAGEPFHADALAAQLGIPYEELQSAADGQGVSPREAAVLKAALQACTASVIGRAMAADPKAHGWWMFYLRNRAGFADHPTTGGMDAGGRVVFVGEERLAAGKTG